MIKGNYLSKNFKITVFGVLVLIIYFLTTSSFPNGGDSAELILAAKTFGIAHPPGYPLYTLLGKLFSFLPYGSVAKRINLMSAFFGAGTSLFILFSIIKCTNSFSSGLVGAGLFSFSPLVWTYAVSAEVFSLNNFFLSGLIFFSFYLSERKCLKDKSFLLAFWIGLSLTNQQILIFYGLPLLFWINFQDINPKKFLKLGIFLLIGLAPYSYLPWASTQHPFVEWGDQTTLAGFLKHILRLEYGTFSLAAENSQDPWIFFKTLYFYFEKVNNDFTYIGLPLAVFGIIKSIKNEKWYSLIKFWSVSTLLYLVAFSALSQHRLDLPINQTIVARFFQQANIVIALLIGIGWAEFSKLPANKLFPWVSYALVVFQFMIHFKQHDQSKNEISGEISRAFLQSLPHHSIVFTRGDQVAPSIRYVQLFENYRPDIIVLDQNIMALSWGKNWIKRHYPEVLLPDYGAYSSDGFKIKDFLDLNVSRHHIFFIFGLNNEDKSYENHYERWPLGLTTQILPKGVQMDIQKWDQESLKSFSSFDIHKLDDFSEGAYEHEYVEMYWNRYHDYGIKYLMIASARNNDKALLKKGIKILEWSLREYPKSNESLWRNLILGYQLLGEEDRSASEGLLYSLENFLKFLPEFSPTAEFVRNKIKNLKKLINDREVYVKEKNST